MSQGCELSGIKFIYTDAFCTAYTMYIFYTNYITYIKIFQTESCLRVVFSYI